MKVCEELQEKPNDYSMKSDYDNTMKTNTLNIEGFLSHDIAYSYCYFRPTNKN